MNKNSESYANVLKQAQKLLDNKDSETALHVIRCLSTKHDLDCEDLAWAYWKEGNYTDQEIQELINDAASLLNTQLEVRG